MEWRVACVRIPRFPIGAVQRVHRQGDPGKGDAQLVFPMEVEACCSTAERHWDERSLALTDGSPNRPRLRSVSAAAAREGVRAGMSLAEARALCAKLETLSWDDVLVDTAITATTALLVQASPQVSPVAGAPGMWWVGASGFAPGVRALEDAQTSDVRRQTSGDERVLAATLQRLACRWHPRARVAIADSCVAARAATWAGASF